MSAQIGAVMSDVEARLADYEADPNVMHSVLDMSIRLQQSDHSPVQDVIVLSRAALAAGFGMGSTLTQGQLHITEIFDRAQLYEAVLCLRASADIFEAIMREGAQ